MRHVLAASLGRSRCAVRVSCSADTSVQRPGSTYRITVRKPLGLVLGEKKPTGEVFVEEVVQGGNADKLGVVQPGDVLLQCSATVLKSGKDGQFEREGYGQRPYDNWDRIMFDARGQDFDTVMAAIASNNERWGIRDVTLEMQRPGAAEEAVEDSAAS